MNAPSRAGTWCRGLRGSPKGSSIWGCGPGNSTAVLRRRWPLAEIVGIDSSSEMIAAARRDMPQGKWERADISD